LGVPPEPLMDAAQDVFLVALRRLDDFEGRSSLTTWLYGICLRVAHEYRRRGRSSRETLVDVIPEIGAEASQEFAVTQTEWQRALEQLLNQLDESQRDIFVLFEIQRLSMKEVAEIVGCPLPTAYFRHKAARTRVLEAFQRQAAMEEL
jgi:RNA polymerase sigma-70 factor (ECF subfamily)